MITQIEKSNHRCSHSLTPLFHDPSILMQLIIDETIRSHQLFMQINSLLGQEIQSPQHLAKFSVDFNVLLDQLIGSPLLQEFSSSSFWTKGTLTKLKEYCRKVFNLSAYANKHLVNFNSAIHLTWQKTLYAFELFHSIYSHSLPRTASTIYLLILKQSFDRILSHFNKAIKTLPGILTDFWDNENVLFYLLRNKDALENIYGPNFLRKQFKCPHHPAKIQTLLMERYQTRGFEAVLPIIQNLFEVEIPIQVK